MNYTFQFGVALDSLPALIKASILTVELSFFAFWGGSLIGLAGAAAKTFGGGIVRKLAQSYVVFFTNTPALLQIYFLYYGLPEIGILLPSFACVLLGLTLNAGAYLTEIQRAGFLSVRQTEIEAAENAVIILNAYVFRRFKFHPDNRPRRMTGLFSSEFSGTKVPVDDVKEVCKGFKAFIFSIRSNVYNYAPAGWTIIEEPECGWLGELVAEPSSIFDSF